MTTKRTKQHVDVKPKYKPTSQERAAMGAFLAQRVAKPAPRMKVVKGEKGPQISPDHPVEIIGSALLMEALGTADLNFLNGLLVQLANAGSQGREIDERELNFMLSVIKGIVPRDQIEAMLAAQMAAVHMATMTLARRLAHVDNIPQQDSAERAFNKLARTFAAQVEALKRYRTGGEQKVTVQHVSVSEGGQAIVGNVTQDRRETAPDKAATSPPALTEARTAPMTIVKESERERVPLRRKSNK
jgi:hypothetical protein